jgi:hypothetical protein
MPEVTMQETIWEPLTDKEKAERRFCLDYGQPKYRFVKDPMNSPAEWPMDRAMFFQTIVIFEELPLPPSNNKSAPRMRLTGQVMRDGDWVNMRRVADIVPISDEHYGPQMKQVRALLRQAAGVDSDKLVEELSPSK